MENRTINMAAVAEIAHALRELKDQMVFIGGAVVSLYADDPSADSLSAHIHPIQLDERYPVVLEKIKQLLNT